MNKRACCMKRTAFCGKKIDAAAINSASAKAQEVAARASEWGVAKAAEASEWAKPRLEQGRVSAEQGVARATEASHELRERLHDSRPVIDEAIQAARVSGEKVSREAARRSSDAAAVLRGDAQVAPAKKRGGLLKKALIAVLLVASAGAAAFALRLRKGPAEDPWARPLTDPYLAPTSGRESTLDADAAAEVAADAIVDAEAAEDAAATSGEEKKAE